MHIGDLLHTQPAELTGTHSAVHTVTAAIVGLHDVGTTARARFDLLCIFNNRVNLLGVTTRSAIVIYVIGILEKYPERTFDFWPKRFGIKTLKKKNEGHGSC